ncbi:MAG: YfhO family protein, partial [candidate division WOR-3 bacterium]|nr:YfhO family protein [candidate division WOR-3 bacterium]MDW7988342.1 YfhO family protein [candidate division WOR-3 bacterium]
YGSDWLLGGYPAREVITRQITKFKTIPMWYNYIFSGLPTVAGPYGDVASLYPFIRLIIPTHIFWTYLFVIGIMIAGIGMYLFLKSLEISNLIALLGAITYMFCGNLVSTTYAGHEGRMLAIALFPLAFFFWNKGISTKSFRWFVFAGATAGFSMTHAHFQLTYYGLWVAFAYFVVRFVLNWKTNAPSDRLKLIVYLGISVLVALGILAVNYLPLLANLKYGARGEIRGYEFASSWSLPITELFDLINPYFSGILENYWGENPFKLHTEYFGIVFLLLAILGVMIKFRDYKVSFFFVTGIVATLIALGGYTPFFKLIYYILPGIRRFRGPSMAFYLVTFSAVVLGAIGLQYLLTSHQDKKLLTLLSKKIKRFAFTVIIGFVSLILLWIIAKGQILSSIKDTNKLQAFNHNLPILWQGIAISGFLILITVIVIYYLFQQKISHNTFLIITILIILFDLWRIDRKFLKSVDHPDIYYSPDEVVRYLKNDTTLYRVHPLYYDRSNDGIFDLHNIQNAGGYCPNPLQTYQDFIGAERTVMYSAPNLMHQNFLNLLNIKYIISTPLPDDISRYDFQTQQIITELKNFTNRHEFELVYAGRKSVIYKNNKVLPRAFVVPNYIVITNKEQIFELLKDTNFDPSRTVILSDSISQVNTPSDNFYGVAKIIKYSPNQIILEAELNSSGFLVLSENYHPDWKCKIDGLDTKIYRAYHTLRAVFLNSGKHTVEFYYSSKLYKLGVAISSITFFFVFLCLIFPLRTRKVRFKN